MSWFQPLSLEPLYKFELIGMLTGLAVYNGLTLPVTFPLALYSHLMGKAVKSISAIEDGWPELAKGLLTLSRWDDGDVADVFMRTYTFSVDVFGSTVDFDMDAWQKRRQKRSKRSQEPSVAVDHRNLSKAPQHGHRVVEETDPADQISANPFRPSNPSSYMDNAFGDSCNTQACSDAVDNDASTPMVTNANRNRYIEDYVRHLTYTSVAPQINAFATGFHRCLNRKSLKLFDVSDLKDLVEGHEAIDTRLLQHITRYDGGYNKHHQTILRFWTVVNGWGQAGESGQGQVRRLLEFVTASDRLPVGGMERVTFVIQKNGTGNERLPTSLTCFGRLLLPDYSDTETMRKALERAIEEAKGFGVP